MTGPLTDDEFAQIEPALEALRSGRGMLDNPENWHEPRVETTMTVLEVLTAARDLIEEPEHWTSGYWSWTPEGGEPRWNALDALRYVTRHGGDYTGAMFFLEEVVEDIWFLLPVAHFFAVAAHDITIDVFDQAIEKAEEEQRMVAGVGVEPT